MYSDLMDDMDDLDGYSIEPNFFLDVPFVPTDDVVMAAMLQLAEVTKGDLLYDLGSGDGRIVIDVARRLGIRSVGIELDPLRISEAMEDAAHLRVEHLVDFIEGSIFTEDFSQATVITLYLLDSVNVTLRPRLLNELRPGTRIVSHAFDMGDWEPDAQLPMGGISLYKWVVPAQVEGAWQWEESDGTVYYIELEQKYQKVTANAWVGEQQAQQADAVLVGGRLELTIQADQQTEPYKVALYFRKNQAQPEIEAL